MSIFSPIWIVRGLFSLLVEEVLHWAVPHRSRA